MTDICSSGRTSTTSPARQPKPDDNFNPHSLTQIILFNYECTKLILFLKNLFQRTGRRFKLTSPARVMGHSIDRSIVRSFGRSLSRSVVRLQSCSIAPSTDRSVDRSIARSLARDYVRERRGERLPFDGRRE